MSAKMNYNHQLVGNNDYLCTIKTICKTNCVDACGKK